MSLVDRLESTGERSFAVVGLAKNCGKTTVVNHLIGEWGRRGVRLGLTSIGRDGEPVDLVTRLQKLLAAEQPQIPLYTPQTLTIARQSSFTDWDAEPEAGLLTRHSMVRIRPAANSSTG